MSSQIDTSAAEALHQAEALDLSLMPLLECAGLGLRPAGLDWQLLAWAPAGSALPPGLVGQSAELYGGTLLTGAPNAKNAETLRRLIPSLAPRLLGSAASVGLGDRLGMATPGHIAALRANPRIAPVLAQQSARELSRTARSFQDVLDAATFGAMAAGWHGGYGADADHLKTIADLDVAIAAGFTMFTADPIDLVPNLPADAPGAAIKAAFERVPWSALEDDPATFENRYPQRLDLGATSLPLPRLALGAAAARFGAAVVQIVAMYRRLVSALGRDRFEFEVAVDEIDHPTTVVDHIYLATELHRLGVEWVSLAPRFVGRFEKGVDYIGDALAFESDVAAHAAVAEALGPYKLSVHSGSDKFSIYDVIASETGRHVHLKTSGTSYLVALGTIAISDPDLMRRIWRRALEAYASSRASYHVSAHLAGMPEADGLSPSDLAGLLDDRDTRQILHVTYGAVLDRPGASEVGDELRAAIWSQRDAYWADLAGHIGRHLRPFAAGR